MRPILVEIPSQLLFFVALALAVVTFVRDLFRRARTPSARRSEAGWSSTPLYFLAGAAALAGLRGPGFIPESGMFEKPWLPVPIYAYGVMLGTSLIVGWFLAMRLAKNDGVPQEQSAAIYMWTAVWAIIGARILYVLANAGSFKNPIEILMIQRGGLVAYGGFIGGFLGSWYNCHKRKIPLLKWADVSAPSVVLGTGITRIGCFLYGCDYGRRTDLPWALSFPKGSPAWKDHLEGGFIKPDALGSLPLHPTQLYEMLFSFALFGALMLMRRTRRFSGQVFVLWVMGYGLGRPLIEILRDDDQRGNVGPLSTSQFIGVVAFALGAVLLVALWKRHRRDPDSLRYWEEAVPTTPDPAPDNSGNRSGGAGKKHRRNRR